MTSARLSSSHPRDHHHVPPGRLSPATPEARYCRGLTAVVSPGNAYCSIPRTIQKSTRVETVFAALPKPANCGQLPAAGLVAVTTPELRALPADASVTTPNTAHHRSRDPQTPPKSPGHLTHPFTTHFHHLSALAGPALNQGLVDMTEADVVAYRPGVVGGGGSHAMELVAGRATVGAGLDPPAGNDGEVGPGRDQPRDRNA